jgi:hypothetical protein
VGPVRVRERNQLITQEKYHKQEEHNALAYLQFDPLDNEISTPVRADSNPLVGSLKRQPGRLRKRNQVTLSLTFIFQRCTLRVRTYPPTSKSVPCGYKNYDQKIRRHRSEGS